MYTDANNSLLSKAPQASSAKQEAPQRASNTAQAAKIVELRPAAEEQQQPKELAPSQMAELKEAVESLNQSLQTIRRELRFSVDDDTGRMIVRVINADTDEVVRQIPSEQLLNAVRHLQEHAGLLLDTEA